MHIVEEPPVPDAEQREAVGAYLEGQPRIFVTDEEFLAHSDGRCEVPMTKACPPSPTPSQQRPSTYDYGVPQRVPERDADYLRCAREMGFDPEFVEVIADGRGKPMGAKTSVEVPARVHRPCLLKTGGYDRPQSSYGNPPVPDTAG